MATNDNKVIIIGAGIAGLSAAIHAQMAGFETEIYESHIIPGGMCTVWKRNGYTIDNCVHWLTCSKENMQLHQQWINTGIIGDDVPMVQLKEFYTSELNGKKLTLWSDLEKTRKELIEFAPEDKDEINLLFKVAKLEQGMQLPTFKPITAIGLFNVPKILKTMKPMLKGISILGKETISDYKNRFKNPLLQCLVSDMVPNAQFVTSFIAAYATITSGNGDFPKGGSETMINNMVKRYESLGGKLFCNSPVISVNREKNRVKSIVLKNGDTITGNYFIFATDPHVTFNKLLPNEYMPKKLRIRYENKEGNPIFTAFHVAFSVDETFTPVDGTLVYDLKNPVKCGPKDITRLCVKTYRHYEGNFAPEGKDIIQVHLKLLEEDYDYWKNLYDKGDSKETYKKEKAEVAAQVLNALEERFPDFKGKIHIIDTWSPATYNRFTGAYKGAYMTFVNTKNSGANYITNKIKGLKNTFIASNWLMSPGGLPCALAQGYYAFWYMNKEFKKNHK